MTRIKIYDTTLRDGAQGEGVSFSPMGKLRLAKKLDFFGVDYIEGGYAASNPKDMAFFKDVKKENLKHAKICAFGSTRRANINVAEDIGARALIEADTDVVTIFGKTWDLHVFEVLRTTEDENLAMIRDTVRFLKQNGKEVIYDAEHFFDGYRADPDFALRTLQAAEEGGADCLVLCDTNGGCLPNLAHEITATVVNACSTEVGVHTHNDAGMAAANAIEAVRAGAMHVQGTINGFGERTGNCDLITVLPALQLKMAHETAVDLTGLREMANFAYEMADIRPNTKAPYVGASAFAHKAGMHVNGVQKTPKSFEHIEPQQVGNDRRVLVSELSGASNVLMKASEMGFDVDKNSPEVRGILKELERLESAGYQFEGAEASFHMLIQKVLNQHKPFFDLEGFRVIVEKRRHGENCISEATVRVSVDGESELTVGEGDGPVDALNEALRKALARFHPELADVVLQDYQVRILDPEEATAAKTRVLIESGDGKDTWGTVGVSENLIEASWDALVDSLEYKLFLSEEKNG